MKDTSISIIVATHKKYRMPDDDMYLPLLVGACINKQKFENDSNCPYLMDDTGKNISELNPSFCELTGLYWAWQNLDSDYIGLVHYRRYFSRKCISQNEGNGKWDLILRRKDIAPLLNSVSVFVPTKRKYYIETLYSHYAHTHYKEHLDDTRDIIKQIYPEYLEDYDYVLKQRSGYMFNMMILKNELMNEYSTWLFDILFKLKDKYDHEDLHLDSFQSRFYGRVSEILFNVWLKHKVRMSEIDSSEIMELNFIYMEKINYTKKVISFLKAKFFHKKYEGSF